ncbi:MULTISPECIES: serine/threonine-protein kinase [Spirulina sp. CCY15215]|uniref:serine/threonine-protein kinase n=1 Tax=Spirulina sp. CCY15215 TaxID=2767591 RepID=UPI00194FF67F|nr:serine/threonine-protein kinase [Spirulina major]
MAYWKAGHSLQNGKYIIEEMLGSGGFGVTYRAKDTQKGQQVAIKTLSPAIQAESDFNDYQQRFIQEAFRLAKCPHRHIVRVDDVFSEGELWCMVMECIDGGDLQEYVGDRGILSESEALQYIQQVGEALSYLHQQQFLHRDVKPANILLRRKTKEAVLIDFGLVRDFIEGKTLIHTNALTHSFAPPEQYKQRAKRGAFTDVYALSATLYYLLTNKLPFPANFREDMEKQGVNLTPPQQYNPQISSAVNQAILKGMELSYGDRPQSVREWLGLLQKQPSSGVKLVSAVGMDYRTLQGLLAAGKWREANDETAEVMLKVAGRESEGWLNTESIDNFPCSDLSTIDQLWVHYSKGRFGFSVQKRIYQSLGGTREYNRQVWENFGDAVGWRVNGSWLYYRDSTFNPSTREGHLPIHGFGLGSMGHIGRWVGGVSSLASRLVECSI